MVYISAKCDIIIIVKGGEKMEYKPVNSISFFLSTFYFTMNILWTETVGGKDSQLFSHDHSKIIIIKNGTASIEINRKIYNLKKWDFAIIPKQTPHRYLNVSDNFERITINPYFMDKNCPLETEIINGAKDNYVHTFTDNMHHLLYVILDYISASGETYLNVIENIFSAFIFEIFKILNIKLTSETENRNSKKDSREVSHIISYIRKNTSQKLNATDVANHFNMSTRQLDRIMIKHRGLSTKSIIDGSKRNKACMLLSETNFSLSEIAVRLGFSGLHSFDTFFKRMEKISPSEYRKNSRNI